MIRMGIKNIIVGGGPLPSAIILRPVTERDLDAKDIPMIVSGEDHEHLADGSAALDELPISVGLVEAASVGTGVDGIDRPRPMTHDLLGNVITALGGELQSVSITRMEGTTFFATLDIATPDGGLHHIDARPSDAVALAVRVDAPILASEDVVERGGMPNFDAIARDEHARELDEFHDFVEGLSPSDF